MMEELSDFRAGLKKRFTRKEFRKRDAEGLAENFYFVNGRVKVFLIPGGDGGLRNTGPLSQMIDRPAAGFTELFDSG